MHLSVWTNPRERNLTQFNVAFTLPESAPVPSMLDDGFVYRRPERRIEATVWAVDRQDVMNVLRYHYSSKPINVVIQ